jgi:pimeloyl-ACP methyl ester carboxylesterase
MKLKQRLAITYIRTKFKILTVFSKRVAAEQAFRLFCTPLERSIATQVPKNAAAIGFTLNGLQINGYRWNHPQPKKALLLHGFGSAAHKFERYAAPLIAKGYEVLAFDAPAHGSSEGKSTNAVEYSAMIKEVIRLYGPIERFLAHSFGGIALSLALETIPHDKGTKIVLIAPATETTSAVDGAFVMLGIKNTVVRKEMDKIIFDISGYPTSWFSIRRAAKNITAGILWIHDEDDDITPLADALKVKEDNHPHINFVITKGLGHRRIYHDPAVKKLVTDFM